MIAMATRRICARHTLTGHVDLIQLGPNNESPRIARAFVRDRLAQHGLAADDAELIASELVTNAVAALAVEPATGRRGMPQITLTITIKLDEVTITVRDASPKRLDLPESYAGPDDEDEKGRGIQEAGRGLLIVSAIADTWGLSADGDNGKTVSATLTAEKEKAR
jgi:anti-sigma regulatory factor (Ser/Thr protein kinase)